MGLRAMRILFKVTITLLLLTVGSAVSAGSIWDGSVSTARYGYLPQTGMYAASNAFPQNSKVTVTNPKTGKKVDVVVIERLEDNNLFLVLSSEAAESIGIEIGDIFHGNISELETANYLQEEELPFNPDPDVNPSAGNEDYSELAVIQKFIDNELGGTDDTLLVSDIVDPIEVNSEPVEAPLLIENNLIEQLPEVEPDLVLELDIAEIVEEIDIIEDDIPSVDVLTMEAVEDSDPVNEDFPTFIGMSAEVPVQTSPSDIKGELPELPVPESDIPIVTELSTGTIEDFGSGTTSIKLTELPLIEVEIIEEEIPLTVTMMTDIVPIEEEEVIVHNIPELVEITGEEEPETAPVVEIPNIDTPVNIEMEVEVVLEPSDLRPPLLVEGTQIVEELEDLPVVSDLTNREPTIVTVIDEPENEINTSVINYNVTRVLAEDSYYLQLGVYREQYSALNLAGSLGGTYPVTVLVSDDMDTLKYKVMVGPLGQDESGAVLYGFQSTGYPDAFLRKGL